MKRHENAVRADEREPEMKLTESFIHHPAGHFGEPEICARQNAEDVASPNHVAEEPDGDHRVDDDFRAEQRLAHAGDQHMRDDSHGGKNGYVHFRMAEKPEEVLPKQRRTASMILEAVADDETRG